VPAPTPQPPYSTWSGVGSGVSGVAAGGQFVVGVWRERERERERFYLLTQDDLFFSFLFFFHLTKIFIANNYFHSIFECLCLLADVISEGGDGISSCSVIGDIWPVVHRENRFLLVVHRAKYMAVICES